MRLYKTGVGSVVGFMQVLFMATRWFDVWRWKEGIWMMGMDEGRNLELENRRISRDFEGGWFYVGVMFGRKKRRLCLENLNMR